MQNETWKGGEVIARDSYGTKTVWALYESADLIVAVHPFTCEWGACTHVYLRRKAGAGEVSWAEKQRVKDELAGKGRTAIEVFPRTEVLVDQADTYHLWVLPEGFT